MGMLDLYRRRTKQASLKINDRLLRRAFKVGGLKTRKETVEVALAEFIQRRRQKELLKLIGTIDFRDDWDPIRERHRDNRHR
jgi:Arc/MetJ family transcription regulator